MARNVNSWIEISATRDESLIRLMNCPASGGTTAGKLREVYADAKARLGHADAVYIDQLDQTEERILAAFEDAVKTAEPDVRALLAIELPKLRACHERIHSLNHGSANREKR